MDGYLRLGLVNQHKDLLLMKQGIFHQTSNEEYYQKMVFGICSLTIMKFKR